MVLIHIIAAIKKLLSEMVDAFGEARELRRKMMRHYPHME
jgi:hypothetical protein